MRQIKLQAENRYCRCKNNTQHYEAAYRVESSSDSLLSSSTASAGKGNYHQNENAFLG